MAEELSNESNHNRVLLLSEELSAALDERCRPIVLSPQICPDQKFNRSTRPQKRLDFPAYLVGGRMLPGTAGGSIRYLL
jgi:hypothetical protein